MFVIKITCVSFPYVHSIPQCGKGFLSSSRLSEQTFPNFPQGITSRKYNNVYILSSAGAATSIVKNFFKKCRNKNMFVATKVLSRQAYFCRDKRRVLSRQTCVMMLVAAPANDNIQLVQIFKILLLSYYHVVRTV